MTKDIYGKAINIPANGLKDIYGRFFFPLELPVVPPSSGGDIIAIVQVELFYSVYPASGTVVWAAEGITIDIVPGVDTIDLEISGLTGGQHAMGWYQSESLASGINVCCVGSPIMVVTLICEAISSNETTGKVYIISKALS